VILGFQRSAKAAPDRTDEPRQALQRSRFSSQERTTSWPLAAGRCQRLGRCLSAKLFYRRSHPDLGGLAEQLDEVLFFGDL